MLPVDWTHDLRLCHQYCDLVICYVCFNCNQQFNSLCRGDFGGEHRIFVFVQLKLTIFDNSPQQTDEGTKFSIYLEESSLVVPTFAVLGLLICQNLFEFLG